MRQTQLEATQTGAVPEVSQLLVLVVDDDAQQRRLTMKLLEVAGCRVEAASNGHEAVDCASACRYDLILMDLQMPVLDGFGAAAAIRAAERRIGGLPVPIVALSAQDTNGTRQHCLSIGMNDHIVKPLSRERVSEVLTQATRYH